MRALARAGAALVEFGAYRIAQGVALSLLGLDTDNDTVFMNETLKTYCEQAGVVFTRCRPYQKNDQAFVE